MLNYFYFFNIIYMKILKNLIFSFFLMIFLLYVVTCSKTQGHHKPDKGSEHILNLSIDKSLKTLTLLVDDQATLLYQHTTELEFLKEAKGVVQINSFEPPKPEWFLVEPQSSKASYFWKIAEHHQNNQPYLTLTVLAEDLSELDYVFHWKHLETTMAGISNILVPEDYILSTYNFSDLQNDQTIIISGKNPLTIEQIQIIHIAPNAPEDNIQVVLIEKNLFEITVFSLDYSENLKFFLQFQAINFVIKAEFFSELPKHKDLVYIDIDHSKIFLTLPQKTKNEVETYKYKILDHQNQILFQSSDIHVNSALAQETIDLNIENILKNNIFRRADLTFKLILTDKKGNVLTQEQKLIYWYVFKSNIPIIRIQVENNVEPPSNKDKKNATYEFYDQINESNHYFLEISPIKKITGTVNVRGSSSTGFPKKSYTISLDKKTELLGFPAHKKWTVIGGWVDKTHLANYTVYHLYQKLGHYAQGASVALIYVNDEYRGIYTFLEKIEQGEPRVPTADRSQGGFILQLENCCIASGTPVISLSSSVKYTYDYPSSPTLEEQNKISQVMNNYINALKNKGDWRALYNEEAEIDLFILNEIFANVDGYGNSKNVLYFLNEKTQKIEPIAYDFVASLGVPFFFSINNSWSYIMNLPALIYDEGIFPLLSYYKKDAHFTNNLKNRYKILRNSILSDTEILSLLNPLSETLEQGKHYFHDVKRWPDLNSRRYTAEEFKEKLQDRLNFVDSEWR